MATSNLCTRRGCVVRVGSSFTTTTTPVTIPDTIDLGEFNTYTVSELLNQYETGIATNSNYNDPITALVRNYGEEPFYAAVQAFNVHFNREDVRQYINPEDTPLLNQRIETNYIFTPIEVAQFIIDFGYTPTDLSVQTTIASRKLPNEVEAFYTDTFTSSTMGSFCSLLPAVFGAVGAFFTALDKLGDLINSLKNFSLNFSLKALLDQLKNKVLNVVDKVVDKVKNVIENFSFENILKEVNKFVNETVVAQFQKIKETAEKFFDQINVENFKKKIEALVDYATSLFKDPKIEEIQYLLLRFCSFIASIENGINAIKNPLNDFANSYRDAEATLAANASGNTLRAVRAGAIRYDTERRSQGINTGIRTFEEFGNPPPLTAEDFQNITPWNNGQGDSRITFNGRWVSALGRDGWERVDTRVRAMLMKVQRDFGKPLFIISGWRSDAYNASLSGAARNSLHKSGLALDIFWSGYNSTDRERFVRLARYYGFRGIGRYGPTSGNFVHIDVGRARQWSKGLTSDDAYVTGAAIPGGTPGQDGADSAGVENPLWTSDDARNVEALREFNSELGGGGAAAGLTEGEREYARAQGYL